MLIVDWKKTIERSYATRPATIRVRPLFRDGATEEIVSNVEETLNLRLPSVLRSLLFQTNGFNEEIELSPEVWMQTNIVAYSVEQILEVNQFHRDQQLYRDRNISKYCLISTAGVDGVQFCIRATLERSEDVPVYAWYPDETPEKCMGEGLFQFLDAWCSSKSSV